MIRKFRFEIVNALGDEDLIPSWAIISSLNDEKKELLDVEEKKMTSKLNSLKEKDDKLNSDISLIYSGNRQIKLLADKETLKRSKLEKKAARKKNVFLAIITFGIYGFLTSNGHKAKLAQKIKKCDELLNGYKEKLANNEKQLERMDNKLKENAIAREKIKESYKVNCEDINSKYSIIISEVKPLGTDGYDTSDFIPLKTLVGMDYQKIKGCYVIHNIEKDKYYVGQSKDVLKRILKDHFTGLEVKNIIFAEDYYNSQYDDKTNLFEVKIIKCETKDELDDKEKELIDFYDSFRNGYNGNSGNN